jgi:hypothetical protein
LSENLHSSSIGKESFDLHAIWSIAKYLIFESPREFHFIFRSHEFPSWEVSRLPDLLTLQCHAVHFPYHDVFGTIVNIISHPSEKTSLGDFLLLIEFQKFRLTAITSLSRFMFLLYLFRPDVQLSLHLTRLMEWTWILDATLDRSLRPYCLSERFFPGNYNQGDAIWTNRVFPWWFYFDFG